MNRPIYGNPATTPNPVADFNQNNPQKADYIKNRPFYEITESIDLLEVKKYGPDIMRIKLDTQQQLEGKKTIIEIVEDGITSKVVIDSVKDNQWTATDSGREYCYISRDNLIDVDSVVGTITVDAKVYCVTGVKQLDEKFIPDRIKYTYVTDKKLGEAVPMIGDTTTFIGLDEELNTGDMIMVKGYFNDGTSESYVVEVGEIGGDYGGRTDADVGRLGRVHVPISTCVTFQSEIKGEVYKLNKKPISEATTELYNIITEIDTALDRVIEKYGLGGFVMPDGAFAMAANASLEKGKYQFVCFEKEDGSIITEIPEHYMINGGIGTDIETDLSSAALSYGYPYLDVSHNMKIFGGFTSLDGDYTVDFETIPGTTYIVKVG